MGADAAREVLVAEVDGAVAGVVAVAATPHLARPDRFARLIGLVLSSAHRRRGLGEALGRAAEARARERGCHRLELTTTRTRAEAPAFDYPVPSGLLAVHGR